MTKKILPLTFLSLAFLLVSSVMASNHNKPVEENSFELPEQARKVSDHVYYLGKTKDAQSGKNVEGYAIVRPKEAFHHKPDHAGGPGEKGGGNDDGGDTTKSTCYEFLGKDAKWRTVENWVMNPTNTRGMDETSTFNTLDSGISKWEDASDGTVGNNSGKNILGEGTNTTATLSADTDSTDGLNEVYFARINDSSAIGVTIVWGVFNGPPFNRELVEWDQIYDDHKFDWSLTGETGAMDFENIAVHELGHSFGLADLYDDSCNTETMYGYASEGETNKRSLEAGDITGVSELYK